MNYTLVVTGKKDRELLERGYPFEKFTLGLKNSSAALELKLLKPDLSPEACIAKIEPVHIHAARDHLVLTNPSILDIQEDEANNLYESVKDIFDEMSSNTVLKNPHEWFIECPYLESLITVTTHQAEGRNIDYWMPQDSNQIGIAKKWRKWQNEIQMIWFNHPVNQKRMSENQLPINSVWVSGIGSLSDVDPHPSIQSAKILHSPDNFLCPIANHLNKVHHNNLTLEELSNSLSVTHSDDPISEEIWITATHGLKNKHIEVIELIDFPEGIQRIRKFKASNFLKRKFLFWQSFKPPILEELLSES